MAVLIAYNYPPHTIRNERGIIVELIALGIQSIEPKTKEVIKQ